MDTIKQIVRQEIIEQEFNRKHIDAKIRLEIEENPSMVAKLDHGVALVKNYMAGEYHESKMKRMEQLRHLDTRTLVLEIFIGIAYVQQPQLFTAIVGQMANRMQFADQRDAILTMSELIAILCETDAYDLYKESKAASIQVVSRVPLSERTVKFIEKSEYLPPMVCKPLELTHNFSSGYLTHNDTLILGTGNHHDGDICLDVLNTMNGVALRLDTEFLSTVEEEPTFDFENPGQTQQWLRFKAQSYEFYKLMVDAGNRFYLTHKVDKRGRIYSQGYHIHSQGTAFKKAMLELADEELIEVPEQYRLSPDCSS